MPNYADLLINIAVITNMHNLTVAARWAMIAQLVCDVQEQEELAEEQLRQDTPQS